MPPDHALPDGLLPDYISPEEIEEHRRRGQEERAARRFALLINAFMAVALLLCELFLW